MIKQRTQPARGFWDWLYGGGGERSAGGNA